MKNTNTSENNRTSKSAAKRNQRKQALAAQKKKKMIQTGIIIAVVACLCLLIGYAIFDEVRYRMNRTTASDDYSAMLTEDGKLDGLDVKDYVVDKGFENIVVPFADVECTDEELDAEIAELLEQYPEINTDSSATVADGDQIHLDHVGYIDGVAFEGGDTKGQGSTLTIGSGRFIDDFEQQLIGTHPGETVTVEVTFPESYPSSPELAGKDATFDVTINGIFYTPEFDDDFVQLNFSEYASTADEYREYLREKNYQANLDTYIAAYIANNSELTSYPKAYVNVLKALQKHVDEYNYDYYNEYYMQMIGSPAYASFEEYIGMSDKSYEKDLLKTARMAATTNMTYQYLFEKYGLTVTDELYAEVVEKYGEDSETIYGTAYLNQAAMKEAVVDYLMSVVTIE